MNEQELVDAGVYDPSAPDAQERLALLELAFESGASLDEVRLSIEEGRLHAVPAMREIEGGTERLTLDEVAARASLQSDQVRRLWRALGLPDPEPDALACTEKDVEALAMLAAISDVVGEDAAFQFARAMGAAMARLADSEIAAIRALAEAPVRTAGGSNLEVAHELLRAAQLLMPGAGLTLDVVHRRHLSATARRYSLWAMQPTERSTIEAVVGFVDLVGFTTLGAGLDAIELDALIRRFEERALDATRRLRARLVKLIGDEAMFMAGEPNEAIEIVEALRDDPGLPPMRAGIAAGTLIVREGDVFGPVVNLAARLVAEAGSGETVVDAEAARMLDAGRVQPLGARTLAGFDAPVEVFAWR